MKKLFDFISKYHTPVLTLIAYQILGVALFKIFYAKDFRCLYITADIAAIAYFLLLFIREGLNIKNKTIKRNISINTEFREKYFKDLNNDVKIINEFRIVEIGNDAVLFVYKDKDNIFNRCKIYIINDFLEGMNDER